PRFFRDLEPHLVHTHSSVPGALGRVAARAAGVPLVVHTVHGFHFHQRSRLPSKLYSLATERALAGLTDLLLMQNREDLRIVRRWRGVRAHLIGNGIDVQRFVRVARPHAGPGRVVACIARFEAVKNHHDLLRVFARVHAACPQARLRLIGDGPLRPQCERAAAELGIAAAVEFVGYRQDVGALLADVDVAVLLSWKEGIPRGLLEPMAAQIPVVAWRVKGTREVVRSGESGLLTPPGDLEQTTAHIVGLLEDPALRRGQGVVVPTLTFAATAEVVTYCDAMPVFVDVEPETLCMDPAALEHALARKSDRVTEIVGGIPVHYGGQMAAMPRLARALRAA